MCKNELMYNKVLTSIEKLQAVLKWELITYVVNTHQVKFLYITYDKKEFIPLITLCDVCSAFSQL